MGIGAKGGGKVGAQGGRRYAGRLRHIAQAMGWHTASGPSGNSCMRNPKARSQRNGGNAGGSEMFDERHAHNEHSPFIAVKRKWAVNDVATKIALCNARRMPASHPIRLHLRLWREVKQFTQVELANALGTTHTTVGRWERGQSGVDDKTFVEIARIYGLTPAELSAPPQDAAHARHLAALLDVARELDTEGLAALAAFAARMRPTR